MKAKRIIAGLSAAVMAATMMAVSASAATKIGDVVYPKGDETDPIEKAWYSLGAMGYFMNNDGKWAWNQGEWCGIDAEGVITVEYKISSILADKSMSDKGSLGEMGVMVCNVDQAFDAAGVSYEEGYPVQLEIKEAKFVAEDGTETVFNDMLNITEMQRDPEGGIRFHIRPTDSIDEDTGDVKIAATPETEGWDEEGAFNGGTLYLTIDFGAPKAADESKADDSSKTDSKADESSKAD
ncbi:hypothetical protein, partial [uncultured Ruminococcus sp.]|uniref:hypothetical protein n=1 Tax=uncultured Ruminococcus sp. TaxID=165186 RepID=UPI0025CF5517